MHNKSYSNIYVICNFCAQKSPIDVCGQCVCLGSRDYVLRINFNAKERIEQTKCDAEWFCCSCICIHRSKNAVWFTIARHRFYFGWFVVIGHSNNSSRPINRKANIIGGPAVVYVLFQCLYMQITIRDIEIAYRFLIASLWPIWLFIRMIIYNCRALNVHFVDLWFSEKNESIGGLKAAHAPQIDVERVDTTHVGRKPTKRSLFQLFRKCSWFMNKMNWIVRLMYADGVWCVDVTCKFILAFVSMRTGIKKLFTIIKQSTNKHTNRNCWMSFNWFRNIFRYFPLDFSFTHCPIVNANCCHI